MSDYEDMLADYRENIDAIDDEIRELIELRNNVVASIHSLKLKHGKPIWDQARVDDIIDDYVNELGDVDGIKIATAIIGEQDELERLAGQDGS